MQKDYNKIVDSVIDQALIEDLGDGDHTSLSTIPANTKGEAQLVAKESGVIAGIQIAEKVFKRVDSEIEFEAIKKDGDKIEVGDVIFNVKGKAISLLSAERLALNFIQRMSGVATQTNDIVRKISHTKTKVLDTRKTTPNLRVFEKQAVKAGGGVNHRFGLFDMVMIKDNHIDFAGGVVSAIKSCQKYLKEKKKELEVEIEVRDFKELNEVLAYGDVNRIMLDNFSPENIKKALVLIDGKYKTEASGGITLDTIVEYAETGVDFISVGALTHHIKSLDLSLKAII
ncbi:MAG: carboxylating nicotinate-nucleotide diphosphorylase [Bacteroidota bacterium]|nr:carboxylating nicotinate-nucleotide diphosphorylase [Bacteroidota bacterium]